MKAAQCSVDALRRCRWRSRSLRTRPKTKVTCSCASLPQRMDTDHPTFAAACWTLPARAHRAWNRATLELRFVSRRLLPFAALYCDERATKGQRPPDDDRVFREGQV